MKKLALLLTGVLAGAVLTTAAPAVAADAPAVARVLVPNTDGYLVPCAASSAGGIDCDWDHPSRAKRLPGIVKVPHHK